MFAGDELVGFNLRNTDGTLMTCAQFAAFYGSGNSGGGNPGGGNPGGGNPGGGNPGGGNPGGGGSPGGGPSPNAPPAPQKPNCTNAIGFAGLGASAVQHLGPPTIQYNPVYQSFTNSSGAKVIQTVTSTMPLRGIATLAGNSFAVAGWASSAYQYSQGQSSDARFAADTLAAGAGVFGGAPGAGLSGAYFLGMYGYDNMPSEPYGNRSNDPKYNNINGQQTQACY